MVYLIHFWDKLHHAQHYIGYTENDTIDQRLDAHKKGRGARLLRVLNEKGIEYDVVRVWKDGDRNFERKLKNQKKSRCLCPLCKR